LLFADLDNTEDEETDGDGITLKRIPPPKQLTLETHLVNDFGAINIEELILMAL
jgi:hypothetical protein